MPKIKQDAIQIMMIQNESTQKTMSHYTLQPVFFKDPSDLMDYMSLLRQQ